MARQNNTFSLRALPGRTALINNQEWLYFSGTNYLGIVQDPEFKKLILEGIEIYGVHFGGSRLSNIKIEVFEQAEQYLAEIAQMEAALTVTSGTLAGRMVIELFDRGCIKCHAPGAHPAIRDNGQFSPFYEQWLEDVIELTKEHKNKPLVVLSNSLDPLRACEANLSWIDYLPDNIPVFLIIDDSHGFGITGENGGGIATKLKLKPNIVLIVISSLGKALGIPGGVIFGPKRIIKALWQLPLFGGASPISPTYLHAFIHAQKLFQEKRIRLGNTIKWFNNHLPSLPHFQFIDQFPVYYTRKNKLAKHLENHQILISSFSYPTPTDSKITRVVLNGLHLQEDLERLVAAIGTFDFE